MRRIERIQERLVYRNSHIVVFDDQVRFPTGDHGTYVRIDAADAHPGVVIVPIHHGKLGLVLTYRYPIDRFQWAFPRGFAHGPDPQVSAREELDEELGAKATSLELLGHVTPDSGLQSTRVTIFRAHVTQLSERTDLDEVVSTRWVTLDELLALVDEGEIEDAFTLSALLLLIRHRSPLSPDAVDHGRTTGECG